MKTRLIVAVVLVVAVLLATLAARSPSNDPIQILGTLSDREIVNVRAAVWRRIHPPILPNLSAQSFKAAPGLIWQRFVSANLKIYRMEARNREFVAVFGRSPVQAQTNSYIFWCVFRGTNGWSAESEYHLTDH